MIIVFRLRKEQVLCVTIDNKDVLIREFSIVKVKMSDGLEITGALKNIRDDTVEFDTSKEYSASIVKVFFNQIENIEVIKE